MISKRPLYLACFFFFLAFSFMRLFSLGERPLHHDEGVNAFFLRNLLVSNDYKYDPSNYHGPSLFYFQLPASWLGTLLKKGPGQFRFKSDAGMTAFSLRSMVALAGILTLLLLLFSRPMVGLWGSITAFLLMGLSCNFLFFSRYFIHETYVVLFTLGIIWGIFYFVDTKKPVFAYIAGLSAVLLFCTKETSLLTFAVLILAYASALIFKRLADKNSKLPGNQMRMQLQELLPALRPHLLPMALLGLAVWFLLFSSFFSNLKGPWDSFRTYLYWGKEGLESGHVKPFLYFINDILIRYELALFVLSLAGVLLAFVKNGAPRAKPGVPINDPASPSATPWSFASKRGDITPKPPLAFLPGYNPGSPAEANEFRGLFLTFWTLGIVAMYSLIPYKTPWLVINLLLPLSLTAGYGMETLLREVDRQQQLANKTYVKSIFLIGATLILLVQIPQSFKVNYREYDNDRHPAVYGHTVRDIFNLVDEIDALAKKSGLGEKISIEIVSGEYWPLPFYLMKYPSAHFWGKREGVSLDAPLIIGESKQKMELTAELRNTHEIKQFNLRPGLPLQLYIRNNLVQKVNVPHLNLHPAQKPLGPLKPGLVLEIFEGTKFDGKAREIKKSNTDFDFWWDEESQKRYVSPFALRWTGFIKIDQEGIYEFSLESDDGSWLEIDKTLIIDNGGLHGAQKLTNTVRLAAGYHNIQIRYFDAGGGAVLKAFKETGEPLTSCLFHQL